MLGSLSLPTAVGVFVLGAFARGYFNRAGGIAAESTPVIKSETVNRKEKAGTENAIEKIEEIRKEKEEEIAQYEDKLSDFERIVRSLKDENVARSKLIENYWKPLHAVVICFTKIEAQTENGRVNFIKKEIEKECELHQLSGSTYIIPPKDVPDRLKGKTRSRDEIENWLKEIYEDYPDARSHIGFIGLVDLRNTYSRTDYELDELPHFFSTIDEELELEEIFDGSDFSRLLANQSVNLTEMIEDGDIAFFASKSVTEDEIEEIHDNQDKIEDEIGNPNLREIANEVSIEQISDALEQFVADSRKVSESIKEEAKIWEDKIYDY